MTAERQKRKQYRAAVRSAFAASPGLLSAIRLGAWLQAVAAIAAYAGIVFLLAAAPAVDKARATEQVVVNWHTGLAIDGYDPVAFFTDGKPTVGSADVELDYGGATWRFANIGNRAAFAARPDIYMPQYGGYDPIGVAQGVAVPGNPYLWNIQGERLFLFYDTARRDRFVANPGRIIAPADRKWPDLRRTLL